MTGGAYDGGRGVTASVRYQPGDSTLLVGPESLLLLAGTAPDVDVDRLFPLIAGGASVTEMLDALLSNGLTAMPEVVLASRDGARLRIIVRGELTALIEDADGAARELSGLGTATWAEYTAEQPISLGISVGDGATEWHGLPLVGGVVRAGSATWDLSSAHGLAGHPSGEVSRVATTTPLSLVPVPRVTAPVSPVIPPFSPSPVAVRDDRPALRPVAVAPIAVAPTAVEPAAAEPSAVESSAVEASAVEASAVEASAVEASAAQPSTTEAVNAQSVVADPEKPPQRSAVTATHVTSSYLAPVNPAGPTRPVGANQPTVVTDLHATRIGDDAEDAYGHLWESTIIRSVEDAAVRIDEESPSGAGELIASVPTHTAGQAIPLGDHDGSTIMAGELAGILAAVPRLPPPPPPPPVAAQLRVSTGDVVTFDRTVIIGRKPSVARVAGSAIPAVLAVPSPQQDISRSHIEFRVTGGRMRVVDLESTNGSLVTLPGGSTQKLEFGQELPIELGAIVDLGDGVIVVVEAVNGVGHAGDHGGGRW